METRMWFLCRSKTPSIEVLIKVIPRFRLYPEVVRALLQPGHIVHTNTSMTESIRGTLSGPVRILHGEEQ